MGAAGAGVVHDHPAHTLVVGGPAVSRARSGSDITEHHWVI